MHLYILRFLYYRLVKAIKIFPKIIIKGLNCLIFNSSGRSKNRLVTFLAAAVLLAGCQNHNPLSKNYRLLSKEDRRNVTYKGRYKVGKEYKVKGKTYKPQKINSYTKVGNASWYGAKKWHGKKTANGDTYNKHMLTAAHRTLPMPCLIKVTNLEKGKNYGKNLIVMVNDRGPYSGNREIDLSEKAADLLGFKQQGVAKVKVQYLHSETEDFLKKLGLNNKEGAKANKKVGNHKCSVNCHIKLVNLKHGYQDKF